MKTGIGIVGLGVIAVNHAKAITGLKTIQLVACCSRDMGKALAFSKDYKCKAYDSYKKFLADPGIDVVVICTPSGFHMEYSVAASMAGKHQIIEKPIDITKKRAEKIIEVALKNSVKISVIFQSRFFESSQLIKNQLVTGRFGELVLGDAYVKWYREEKYYKDSWHGTKKVDGGGVIINQSIHAVDLLRWYMGEVKSIQAYKGRRLHKNIECEDTAVAALEFQNGAFGVIEGSTAVYPGFLKRLEMSGTQGAVVQEDSFINYWNFKNQTKKDEEIIKKYKNQNSKIIKNLTLESFKKQYEDFLNSINTGKSPLVDGIEGLKSLEVVLALYKSAETGKKVML